MSKVSLQVYMYIYMNVCMYVCILIYMYISLVCNFAGHFLEGFSSTRRDLLDCSVICIRGWTGPLPREEGTTKHV